MFEEGEGDDELEKILHPKHLQESNLKEKEDKYCKVEKLDLKAINEFLPSINLKSM
jgi:hypothetical protein